jgi:hypothetical protein
MGSSASDFSTAQLLRHLRNSPRGHQSATPRIDLCGHSVGRKTEKSKGGMNVFFSSLSGYEFILIY